MNTTINKQILGHYIRQNQVVWQKWDGLMEITDGVDSPSYKDIKELWSSLPEEFSIVDRKEMLDTSFADLANWSTAEDIMILAGDEALFCISKFEYEKLTA